MVESPEESKNAITTTAYRDSKKEDQNEADNDSSSSAECFEYGASESAKKVKQDVKEETIESQKEMQLDDLLQS